MITSKFTGLGNAPGDLTNAPAKIIHALPATGCEVWDGFEARWLRNAFLEIAVIPELGGKIVSLKNVRTGREWMYRPGQGVKLFRNQLGDDFARSPVTGWDECLPTIAPCVWRGRSLPDHGEAWSLPWTLDEAAWENRVIKASVHLPVSNFQFTRALKIQDHQINIDYELVNLTVETQEFLWAMHPLLALRQGDRLVLSPEAHQHLGREPWLDSLDFGTSISSCAKVFAGPLREGNAEVANSFSGDRFKLTWDVADCDTLGIWLTRGGWNGHHHLALEPTNGAPDSLAAAGEGKRCGIITAFAKKKWSVQIDLQPVNL